MILWGNEHRDRAEALAAVFGEDSNAIANLPRSNEGIGARSCSDVTLTIWGHGGSESFSEMLDVECGQLIHNWRAQNSSLRTVELVTCDAQHNRQPMAGYASRVASFVERKYKDIKIKSLPGGQHADDRSILWANSVTRTFCYITAPSKATFDHANGRLGTISPSQGYDLALVAAELAKERALTEPNNFTTNGGAFHLLRSTLVVVASR